MARRGRPISEGLVDLSVFPLLMVVPSSHVMVLGMPIDKLGAGVVPGISWAGPRNGVYAGTCDLLGDPNDPLGFIRYSTPIPTRTDLFTPPGQVPDPETLPQVRVYDDPPGDLFVPATGTTVSAPDSVADIRWSDGALLQPAIAPAAILSAYPCGQVNAQGAFTICADGAAAAKGPFFVLQGGVDAAIPLDGTRELQFGAILGSADPPSEGGPVANPPNDPFQGAQRSFLASYVPGTMTWGVEVTDHTLPDAAPGNATANSGVRIIIDGPSVTYLIPQDESPTPRPGARLTAEVTDEATGDDVVDVSSGGPGSTWQLSAVGDPTGIIPPPKAGGHGRLRHLGVVPGPYPGEPQVGDPDRGHGRPHATHSGHAGDVPEGVE